VTRNSHRNPQPQHHCVVYESISKQSSVRPSNPTRPRATNTHLLRYFPSHHFPFLALYVYGFIIELSSHHRRFSPNRAHASYRLHDQGLLTILLQSDNANSTPMVGVHSIRVDPTNRTVTATATATVAKPQYHRRTRSAFRQSSELSSWRLPYLLDCLAP